MTRLSVGLAGVGYWGSKLARNLFESKGCELRTMFDPDHERLQEAVSRYRDCRPEQDFEALIAASDVDALVFATPASMHAEHCRRALNAGKHVLVEKPLALSSAECVELSLLAQEKGLTLMVGHTFLFSEPVRLLRNLIDRAELGELLYVYGQRLNLGVIREDLNALWNFGPHDLSILLHLLDDNPVRISARQFSVLNRQLEDVAFVVVEFESGVVAHVHDSWLDPRKVRQFTVVGDHKMAVYDDTDHEGPLRIYDKGVRRADDGGEAVPRFGALRPEEGYGEFKLDVRAGDLVVPRVVGREPLRTEIEHFVECASTGATPLTDGWHGARVVAMLEAAEESARAEGRAVAVRDAGALVAQGRGPAR